MRRSVYFYTIVLLLVLLPLTACQPGESEASSTTPTSGSTTTKIKEAADDIIFTPGGLAYRANVHQQGVVNPWPSIESVEVAFKNNDKTAYVSYRDYMVTEAGETRNNIIRVRIPGVFDIGDINLVMVNLPDGIKATQGDQYHGPLGNVSKVLALEISPNIQLGEYTFEIGVEIEGVEYGMLPCTLNIVEGTFIVSFLTSTQEVTLDEANDIVGVAFPTPGYLPAGYEIKKIFIYKNEITLLISDKDLDKEVVTKTYPSVTQELNQFQCRMEITINWISDGFYIPPTKIPGTVLDINGNWAKLTPSINPDRLWLYNHPNPDDVGVFEIAITTNKTILEEELIKIAERMKY